MDFEVKIMNSGDIEESSVLARAKKGTARTTGTSRIAMRRKIFFVPEVLAVPDVPFFKAITDCGKLRTPASS
jgi:hypothetical protein